MSVQTLAVAIIQAPIVWHDPAQNRVYFLKKIRQVAGQASLVVLPEMFTTGFSMEPEGFAETMQGPTLSWLQNTARDCQCALVGSLMIRVGTQYYNRLLFVHPSGAIDHYDKKHLFSLVGEQAVYTPGTAQPIVHYLGWKICPLICYDLRFPVWSRNTHNYDLLLYVANWPQVRIQAWDTLLKARAIENLSYTVGVNRTGTDARGIVYNGHSAVYDFLGDRCSYAGEEQEAVQLAFLDRRALLKAREQFGFLSDRDSFSLSPPK